MKDLGHENMVRFYTAFHEKSVSYLALEFVGGGGIPVFLSFVLQFTLITLALRE